MTDFLLQYGLFLAKAITVVLAVGALILLAVAATRRGRGGERLQVTRLNDRYDDLARALEHGILPRKAFRKFVRREKKRRRHEERKRRSSTGESRRRAFVINFHGDIRASAVSSLREEVTAVLTQATPRDEVVVRLENAGGLVHEHGLAASQLMRIRRAGVPLTVVVDKIAASGGYMMACVADRIVAAPFAVVGSIGVLAQIPNFHRLLDRHGVDFEMAKGGEYKRNVTLFGKNTEEDRQRLRQYVEDTHLLFKDFVAEQRRDLDIAKVATGEHWYGRRAIDLKLVDEIMTSDDYLLAARGERDLYEVEFSRHKSIGESIASLVQQAADRVLLAWRQQAEEGRYGT